MLPRNPALTSISKVDFSLFLTNVFLSNKNLIQAHLKSALDRQDYDKRFKIIVCKQRLLRTHFIESGQQCHHRSHTPGKIVSLS